MKNVLSTNSKWVCIAMNHKVKIKADSQDAEGKYLKNNTYDLVLLGKFYSIIQDEDNQQYYINNKYIEKIPRA